MPSTVEDFWRMVTEHNICTMVQLNALPAANVNDSPAINNSGFHYWHESDTSGSQISYGSLQVFFINLLVFYKLSLKIWFFRSLSKPKKPCHHTSKGSLWFITGKKQDQFKKHFFFTNSEMLENGIIYSIFVAYYLSSEYLVMDRL